MERVSRLTKQSHHSSSGYLCLLSSTMTAARSLAAVILPCLFIAPASSFAPPTQRNSAVSIRSSYDAIILNSDSSKSPPSIDEASEYEYNEADFEDYASDYSELDGDDESGDEDDAELLIEAQYDDYSDIGGYDLTPFEKHAREVFLTYADRVQSKLDLDSDSLESSDNEECERTQASNAAIFKNDLYSMLQTLDIEATEEEAKALFKYLDADDSGEVTLEEVSDVIFCCH